MGRGTRRGEQNVSPKPGGRGLLLGLSLGLLSLAGGPAAGAAEPADTSPEPLPAKDPTAFLEKCLQRFDGRDITGYSLLLHKQERIDGTLEPAEDIEVLVRVHPHSVFLHWLQGARRANRALYVEGENEEKILVHPTGLVGGLVRSVALDPNSLVVRESSRYSIKRIGLRETIVRTLDAWRAGNAKGVGRLEYLGTHQVAEAGDRLCYTLRRTTATPENGVTETTVSIDKDTWFQVGTVLKGPDGDLLGAYFYRDITLNPEFAPNQFEPAALAP